MIKGVIDEVAGGHKTKQCGQGPKYLGHFGPGAGDVDEAMDGGGLQELTQMYLNTNP